MIADATIKRLRSQIESRALSPDEHIQALLILTQWYDDQLEENQRAQEMEDPAE